MDKYGNVTFIHLIGCYAGLALNSSDCGALSSDRWLGIFRTGIKKALTVEQLAEQGVYLEFRTFDYDYYEYTLTSRPPERTRIKTEEEYLEAYKVWLQWQATTKAEKGGKSENPLVYLGFAGHWEDIEKILLATRSNARVRLPKQQILQDHYFILTDGERGLTHYTRRGYKYSGYREGAKAYRTEREAERARQQHIEKKRYKADIWRVERINRKHLFTHAA